MVMLPRLRGGGGRPAYYRCTSTTRTWMLSRVSRRGSGGEIRDAEGRVGRCGAAAEVDASVHDLGGGGPVCYLSFFLIALTGHS